MAVIERRIRNKKTVFYGNALFGFYKFTSMSEENPTSILCVDDWGKQFFRIVINFY
jgi:hypothetical protein